jgi:hypothetical protein
LREIDEDLIKKLDEGFFDVCEQDWNRWRTNKRI